MQPVYYIPETVEKLGWILPKEIIKSKLNRKKTSFLLPVNKRTDRCIGGATMPVKSEKKSSFSSRFFMGYAYFHFQIAPFILDSHGYWISSSNNNNWFPKKIHDWHANELETNENLDKIGFVWSVRWIFGGRRFRVFLLFIHSMRKETCLCQKRRKISAMSFRKFGVWSLVLVNAQLSEDNIVDFQLDYKTC